MNYSEREENLVLLSFFSQAVNSGMEREQQRKKEGKRERGVRQEGEGRARMARGKWPQEGCRLTQSTS